MFLKLISNVVCARQSSRLAAVSSLLLCICVQASAQPIEIGRSVLTLPDADNWKVQDATSAGIGYSGDITGAMAMGSKILSYTSPEKLVKAVFATKVTKGGVAGATMNWSNNCPSVKETANVFKADKGTLSSIDCLVVIKVNQVDTFVSARPQLKAAIGDLRPDTKSGFYVQYRKSMGAGGYTVSEALIASDFKGVDGDAVKTESSISPSVLAWATAFAKSNAAAVDSLSGKWSIPALVFNPK